MLTRRALLQRGAAATGAALALGPVAAAASRRPPGFGPLVEDPGGLIDLPRGFRYRVVQTLGDRLSNGAPVPGDFDGMAAFRGRHRSVVLVRNHELTPGDLATQPPVPGRNPYEPAGPGGTTAVVVRPDRRAAGSYVTSAGSLNNCAGGATPWGTWITCEETREANHGFCFEADPRDPQNRLSRTPLRDMGFFSHEALDVDPRTGVVYLTEDDFQLAIPGDPNDEVPGQHRSSFLFRYLPNDRSQCPGALQRGGRLQALSIDQRPSFNVDLGRTADRFQVVWVDVDPMQAHEQALAKGAARFNRLEGAFFAGGAFWFDDTAGGEGRHGQIFRLRPSWHGPDTLELFLEGDSAQQMDSPDNISAAPWGDLWFVEDGEGEQRVMGITPDGEVYEFARNRLIGLDDGTSSEFCGLTFSPDGRTFFVNVQRPGHTFAIWGPWPRGHAGGIDALASSPPRHRFAPKVDDELAEAAAKQGVSPYEAAAFRALAHDPALE